MISLKKLHEYTETLEKLLRLKTYPLAIKLVEKEEDIPEGAVRPKRDCGYQYMTCGAFSESRHGGTMIAQTKQDMWCFEAALGYGFIEPLDFFLEGNTRYPEKMISSPEAAKAWAQDFPRLEQGKYEAIVSAPLATATFEPDLVMIYGDSAQVQQLLMARIWIDGNDIAPRLSGQGACVMSVTPTMLTGECYVAFPCPGDRRRAFAQDDELIFSAPTEMLPGLVKGLQAFHDKGIGIPMVPTMAREPQQLESYTEIARKVGMIE